MNSKSDSNVWTTKELCAEWGLEERAVRKRVQLLIDSGVAKPSEKMAKQMNGIWRKTSAYRFKTDE